MWRNHCLGPEAAFTGPGIPGNGGPAYHTRASAEMRVQQIYLCNISGICKYCK